MRADETFIALMTGLLIFNFIYFSLTGNVMQFLLNISIGTLITLIISAVVFSILSSISVVVEFLASGAAVSMNPMGTRIIFGISVMLGLLFQIKIPLFTMGTTTFDLPIGVGLLSNVFNVFSISDLYGIPFFMVCIIGIILIVSGFQMMLGGSSD